MTSWRGKKRQRGLCSPIWQMRTLNQWGWAQRFCRQKCKDETVTSKAHSVLEFSVSFWLSCGDTQLFIWRFLLSAESFPSHSSSFPAAVVIQNMQNLHYEVAGKEVERTENRINCTPSTGVVIVIIISTNGEDSVAQWKSISIGVRWMSVWWMTNCIILASYLDPLNIL